MLELFRKLRGLLARPRRKLWWAAINFGKVPVLLREKRPGALISFFVTGATGWSIYDHYLAHLARRTGGTIEREVRGNRMKLDLEDRGLSRDLFIYAVREARGTEVFERELEKYAGVVEDETVVEIGANIGYFMLMELNALSDSATAVAFEPDERNVSLLETNLELNGVRESVTIERAAVGSRRGSAEFELSEHSNLNRVRSESTDDPEYGAETSVAVDMWSIDEYLTTHGIDPESVVAARMDVEGYEAEVVRGMETLLAADGPLVLSLEIHPHRLGAEDVEYLRSAFAEHGFDVVEALTESITAYPFVRTGRRDVETVESIPDSGPAFNLILSKPPASDESRERLESAPPLQ